MFYLSFFITVFVQQYFRITLAATLTFASVAPSLLSSVTLDSVVATVSFAVFVCAPFFLRWRLARASLAGLKKRAQVYGAFYKAQKYQNKRKRLYYFYFLVRRLIPCIVFVFLSGFPALQVALMFLASFVMLTYMVGARPFRERLSNA